MPATRTDHWPKTAGYFAVFIALGLETAILGPTLAGLAKQAGTQLGAISYLFTAHALGYMLGSFFGGRGYDRVPGHPLMVGLLASMALVLALVPLMPALWLLAAAWLLLGASAGALDVGGNALLVWVHGRRVGPFMNALHFFFGVGSFLAPLIVALARELSGNGSGAYWILALLMLPVAAWLIRLPSPSSRAEVEEPRGDGAIPAAGIHRHEGHHDDGRRTEEQSTVARRAKEQGKAARQVITLIALLLALYVGAEAAFGGWIHTYAVALDLSDPTTAAYLTSAFWGALTVGRLVAIPLATRYRPRSILLVDLVGCLVSVGILLLWPGSPAAIWLGSLGLGLSMASIFPTAITLAERRVPITGQVTGWFLVASSIGAMTVPWFIGQLFEPVGPWVAMAIILVDLIAATIVYAVLMTADARSMELEQAQGVS
jgi:FHS family Na+ dependent glucose MFS transporter 1